MSESAKDALVSPEASVSRFILSDFRSYPRLDLALASKPLVALIGDNGAGKTNLLEALSLFAPGRGLRRADIAEMARAGGSGGFAVSVELRSPHGPVQLGAGHDPGDGPQGRKFRVNKAPAGSARLFSDYVRLCWLTPAMDGLFAGSPGDRRRFVDRMVLAVDADHGARVAALERAARNRNKLLEDRASDGAWLNATEREVAELSVAVAFARKETIERLDALIHETRDEGSPFPWAKIAMEGEIDRPSPTPHPLKPKSVSGELCSRHGRETLRRGAHYRARKPQTSSSNMVPNACARANVRPANRRRCWSASRWRTPASSSR